MMQQPMSQQDQIGAQQMLQQQAMVQPQQTIIQSQHGMVQPQNGTIQPQHGIVQTQHGLVQPQLIPQQMMLCPVRVVYDSPVLVQPGDQMQQQNQNFFINSQNTPPWARPIQNQFIYVQQMPSNNLVPVQQLDPNHMYIQQNFPNFQQVIPQMIAQNQQEQLRMIPNMVPNSMIPNGMVPSNVPNGMVPNSMSVMSNVPNSVVNHMIQNNIVQNNAGNMASNSAANNMFSNNSMTTSAAQNSIMTNVPSSVVQTNTTQVVSSGNVIPNNLNYTVQGNVQNVQNAATTMQNIQKTMQPNSEVNNTSQQQTVSNENRQVVNQNVVINQNSVGLQTQLYRLPVNPIRTQMPINQMQSMNNSPNLQNVHQQNNIRHTTPNQAVTNVTQTMPNAKEIKVAATHTNTDNTVTYSAVRNGQPYTFRAIQPKPTQYRQFAPMTQMQRPNLNTKYIVPNVQNNTIRSNTPVSNAKTEINNIIINRKRKSESPDEVQKKMPTNSTVYGSMTITPKTKDKIIAKAMNTSEIGTNTSPIHKRDDKKANSQYPILQINPMEAKNGDQKSCVPQLIRISKEENTPMEISEQTNEERIKQLIEKEKLIRNTVFSQARGRVLNDKLDVPNNITKPEENIKHVPVAPTVAKIESGMQTEKLQTMAKVENMDIAEKNAILRELLSKSNEPLNVNDTSNTNETNSNVETTVKVNEPLIIIINKKASKPVDSSKNTQKMEIEAVSSKDVNTDANVNTIALKSSNKRLDGVHETQINEQFKTNETSTNTQEKPRKSTQKMSIPNEPKVNTSKANDIVKNEEQNVKKEKEYKNISANEIKGKEIHMVDGSIVKEEKSYVLTHVLDGYVIQESNVPFAIRKPLKERTINMLIEEKQDSTALSKEGTSDESASTSGDNSTENEPPEDDSKVKETVEIKHDKEIKENILEISQLNLNELEAGIKKEEAMKEDEKEKLDKNDKENPFANLKSSIVKAWTTEDISTHLQKYNWTETVSILSEHEIDGESLLLVSASQLAHIGVSETHANLICEFVNNRER